ncbi:MAG: Methionine--tRNA ligase [Chlamydiae bacterium]|nr:Methionine--tRNA ligase [Chlamydiota bacterium]
MTKKILITSALLYANGSLHFGHLAGAYLPAECYARFMRFQGHEVLFISGSDEYGAAITLGAEKAKRLPKEHVDDFHAQAIKTFSLFNFSFDHYSRTTWKGHDETVLQFYHDLKENGYIEKKVTWQLFSEIDQKFLADRYVQGTCPKCQFQEARGDECPKCGASFETSDLLNPVSKLTKAPLALKETEHSFFLLDKLKGKLKEWIEKKDWKPQVLNMALQYIEEARPRSITRDLTWGIPLPGEEGKVFYVWFDAPIGYISAAKEWAEKIGKRDAWKDYWLDPKTHYVQFIGKDNIPFHAVFFPAMEMGQNTLYKKVDELPANSFFHYEGKKFSKSDGWTIDLVEFFKKYQTDSIRYALAANAPESGDSEFSWKDFQSKNNADLVGKFGNYINRVLVFLHERCQGVIPKLISSHSKDHQYLEDIKGCSEQIVLSFENFHLRRASAQIMELATLGNIYFDEMQPWKTLKTDLKRTKAILAHCLEGIKVLAIAAYPIIPETSEKIWHLLGFKDKLCDINYSKRLERPLQEGQPLLKPEILFQKIENEQIEKELKSLHAKKTKEPQKKMIDIQNFMDVDLRVGEVIQAEDIPKSNKLLKLLVDIGDEKRTVVSGIKKHYQPEELVGKKVILVSNLKPAKIMGVESHGMILAGSHENLLEMPSLNHLPAGSKVS